MVKSKLTVAQHKNIAYDAFVSRDYLTATKHYSLALHKYPPTLPSQQLGIADMKLLKERRDTSRKLYKSSKKGY